MRDILKNKFVAYVILAILYSLQKLLDTAYLVQHYDYRNNKARIFLILSFLYAAMIFYLSSQSNISVPSGIFELPLLHTIKDFFESSGLYFVIDLVEYSYYHRDKIAHIFLYFGFGIFLHLAFKNSENKLLRKYAALFAVLLGIAYGITDEIHQSYVPGRTASVHDLLADGIGVIIAQILFILFILLKLKKRKGKKNKVL